jgi:signal transduction protein with GAF and PtsI domain
MPLASADIPKSLRIALDQEIARLGLPGKVWLSRKPRYISDLVREANFQRTPVAARERLHAAFGFPILLGGEVLGVIEFFSREIRQPDEEWLERLATNSTPAKDWTLICSLPGQSRSM